MHGLATTPLWTVFPVLGFFCLLLFDARIAAAGVTSALAITYATTVAERLGALPSAPMFATSPIANGRPAGERLWSPLLWPALVSRVTFGASQKDPSHCASAVACAIEMRNAMRHVNERNARERRPELEMGIGINTAEVIVWNIGSEKRSRWPAASSAASEAVSAHALRPERRPEDRGPPPHRPCSGRR